MGYLGAISSYGFLTVYVLISVAAPIYLHNIRKLKTLDVVFSVLAVAFMMIPILGSVGIPGSKLFPPPEAPYNAFPWLFVIYIIITCGWFFKQSFGSPRLVRGMQQEVDEVHARFNDAEKL